eukprot:UN18644
MICGENFRRNESTRYIVGSGLNLGLVGTGRVGTRFFNPSAPLDMGH